MLVLHDETMSWGPGRPAQRDRYVPDGMADPASGLTIEIVA